MTRPFSYVVCVVMPTFIQTNLTLGVCGRKCCALYVGGGKRASTMSFIYLTLLYTPTSYLVLKNMLLPQSCTTSASNCPKTQTQKSNPLKSLKEWVILSFKHVLWLPSFFGAFCYLVLTCFLLQLA